MNLCLRKSFPGLSALVFLIASTPAPADVLLNTITGPFFPQGGGGAATVGNTPDTTQSAAVSFSSPTATTISEIDAFIGLAPLFATNQTITLGIMSDAAGLPSGSFLNSSFVILSSSNPVILNSLDWSISGGTTYWLTAIASSGTFGAFDRGSDIVPWAFTGGGNLDSNWARVTNLPAPEAEIFSVAAAIPELSTCAMMILGFAGIGHLAYRRKSVRLRLA